MSLVVAVVGERVVEFSVGLSVCNASMRDGRTIEKVALGQITSSQVRSVLGTRCLSTIGQEERWFEEDYRRRNRKDLRIGLRST